MGLKKEQNHGDFVVGFAQNCTIILYLTKSLLFKHEIAPSARQEEYQEIFLRLQGETKVIFSFPIHLGKTLSD